MNSCLHSDGYHFANVWCFGDGDFFIDSSGVVVMAVACCMSQMEGGRASLWMQVLVVDDYRA